MSSLTIDVISDTVCPWCYVGQKRLHSAINQYKSTHPDATFNIKWHPFYLNPSAPTTSIDKRSYMTSRFGAERVAMMHGRISAIGRECGINFSFGGKTGNTRDSHRLVHLASLKGKQEAVVERLFKGYFEEERDIVDRAVLTELAVDAGLEKQEVEQFLGGEGGGPEVDREVEEARLKGISGVPNFTVNGKWVLGGAQEEAEFIKVFEEAAKA